MPRHRASTSLEAVPDVGLFCGRPALHVATGFARWWRQTVSLADSVVAFLAESPWGPYSPRSLLVRSCRRITSTRCSTLALVRRGDTRHPAGRAAQSTSSNARFPARATQRCTVLSETRNDRATVRWLTPPRTCETINLRRSTTVCFFHEYNSTSD